MSVYSMTGYATGQTAQPNAENAGAQHPMPAQGVQIGLEIRSVNSRFLDISFRLSEELRSLEPQLREMLGKHLKRGKVELRAFVETSQAQLFNEPSPRLLQRLASVEDQIKAWLPQATPLSVHEVLRMASTEESASASLDPAAVLKLAQQVLDDFMQSRAREGHKLTAVLLERCRQLRALAQRAQPLVPQLVEQQRKRFLDKWQDALDLAGGTGADTTAVQDRALSEATAFAIRIDVAEELERLQSHLAEIERLLSTPLGELGKRLDFLIQELHREANTLGSKSAVLEMTQIAVDMKVLIEQMREQVQNLE